MGELQSALDALAADDLPAAFPTHLLDRLGELLVAANRLAAEIARTVRECERTGAAELDGQKTMASWLRGHARVPAAAASRVVHTGRALEHLPVVAAAFAAGAVTTEAAAAIAPIAAPQNLAKAATHGVDVAAVDAALAEVAAGRPHAELAQVVAHYLGRLDPDGPEPDPTEERELSWSRRSDGGLDGRFHLDPVAGDKFVAAVESHVQADRPAGDERTRAQRQGDALAQLCDNALASGQLPITRTVKPHVFARIDLDALIDPSTGAGAAVTQYGTVISAARARWLSCDGNVSRVVFGPDSAVLDLGRHHRVADPHLRRAVELRDGGCVFTGCDAPAWWCDVHHLVHWAFEGDTCQDNSALLCERHHTKVHHGFRVERLPDGRWRTWRPDGTEILLGAPFPTAA
ncbi:UNVERIFIED_ORG: HNH endonuclease [Bacillus sp. AZ43]